MKIDIGNDCIETTSAFLMAFGKEAERAVVRSVNRAVQGIETDGVKLIRQEYNIKAGDVRKAFKIKRAGNGVLEAAAIVSGGRIPLIRFGARPAKLGGRKPLKGVSVLVKKARKTIRHSFVARMKSGHVGVFQRDRNRRLPISEKFSLAVPQMLENPVVIEQIQEGVLKRYERTLTHEINLALNKMGAR